MGPGNGRLGAATLIAATLVIGGCGKAERSAPVAVGTVPSASHVAASPTAQSHPMQSTTGAPATDPYPGRPLIDHTQWTNDPDGRRLHVVPTDAGRKDWFGPALNRAWSEVLADAPDADTPGMFDQFKCHWQWARLVEPNKPDWNLEPWRPAVGYDATVQALCNPGGPDPAGK
ncbi:DUF2599 domain-containing protein [Nocardia alni]|uniref:DUF2599 domain-containing protein n=1 Tax=Nocardia alni TaxID=2815723 RepID=UPI001C2450CC|nr:DUF2599 domain-containing protein [Nocardia alni]